jgi:hypothetical protein
MLVQIGHWIIESNLEGSARTPLVEINDTYTCEFIEDEWRPTFVDNDYDLYDDYYNDD